MDPNFGHILLKKIAKWDSQLVQVADHGFIV